MVAYTNDLRLAELATGEGSGTWGNTTNTNLELIAEAFSFGTEAITTNADAHTPPIADGSTDPGRSLFLKYTGTLDSTCTITIGPNTVSKLWFIENATSGSQSIIIKQGSGATITVPNGQVKAIYSDGAGSGAAMVDAFQDLSVPDLFIDDDLTFTSDSAVITFGADGDTTLTHTDGSGLTLNSTNKLMFNDASQFIQGSSATVLSLGATDEIDLTATAIDVNGTMDVSGALTGTTATFTTADNTTQLTLKSTDDDATAGPVLDFMRDSASPADSDVLGQIRFRGQNDASEDINYARINTQITDASDGTEDSQLNVITVVNGTARNRITLNGSGAVINQDGQDLDFRVESSGNANMLFVDAGNNRVGIGTSSPDTLLELVGADPILTIRDSSTSSSVGNATLRLAETGASDTLDQYFDIKATAGQLQIIDNWNEGGGTGTRVVIDDSGNLLVGTTDTDPANNSANSTADDGVAITAVGEVRSSRYLATANSGAVGFFNRTGTDGDIVRLRKSGSSVGSIGTLLGNLTVGTGDTGVQFNQDVNAVIPHNISTGANVDNSIDLGYSDGGSTNLRFKDLYLSGGAFLGGTTAANYLDDYEEGTWTPLYGGGTTDPSGVTYNISVGRYIKIGHQVVAQCRLRTDGSLTQGSGFLSISGLPFTSLSVANLFGAVLVAYADNWTAANAPSRGYVNANETRAILVRYNNADPRDDGSTSVNAAALGTGSNSNDIICEIIYRAA